MNSKVVFYNPQSSASRKKILPMSILALGGVLEGRCEYEIVDGNVSQQPLDLIRSHVHQGAEVVAITVMPGPQLARALPDSRALKSEFPKVKLIWGGYFPTLHASTCLSSPAVDFVVRGHAEPVLVEFLNRLERDDGWRTLPGLAYRNEEGVPVENPLPPVPHPAELPPYPYHRVEMTQYIRKTFLGSRTLPHHSSYGCPFRCNFCAVVNLADGRWLAQSAGQVAAVAEDYVRRWRVDAIEFYDNNFFTHEGRVAEIADRIARFGLAWWGEARIDTLLKFSETTWRLMKTSGLRMVFLGAESASDQTLRRMDKGGSLTPEKTLEIAAKTKTYGILPEFSFVVGNPPDPEQDTLGTIEFIRRLKRVNPASEIILYNYTPVPLAGDLYGAAKAKGFSFPATLDDWISPGWMRFSSRKHARVPWLGEPSRRKIKDFERVLNAYYPTVTDGKLTAYKRALLRAASWWRYQTRVYALPLELQVLQRVFHYQRPETAGF